MSCHDATVVAHRFWEDFACACNLLFVRQILMKAMLLDIGPLHQFVPALLPAIYAHAAVLLLAYHMQNGLRKGLLLLLQHLLQRITLAQSWLRSSQKCAFRKKASQAQSIIRLQKRWA